MASVVIHSSPLPHQMETAGWLSAGFRRHGLEVEITHDRDQEGDIHVVQGPHYALRRWMGQPRVLFFNRCFYGDPRFDLSLGWLNADGSRDFMNRAMPEPNGQLPELKPMKPDKRKADQCAMYFGDYGEDPTNRLRETLKTYGRTYYRPHPQDRRDSIVLSPDWSLEQIWEIADVAVGGAGTVLVDAAINGLHVDCWDERSVAYDIQDRKKWLTDLSWAQWHYDQLQSGAFWGHLCIN